MVTGSATSSYKYDESGNRIFEGYQSGSTWLEYANVAYDAMNRMTSLDETGAAASTGTPTITWKYDLAGNIRNMHAVYNQIDDNGNVVTGTDITQDYWYKYDSMNRFVLTKGKLLSGAITIEGTVDGRVITYNAAGQRATVTKPMVDDTWTDQETHHVFTYHVVESEIYTYSADGYLAKVETAYDYSGATDWQTDRNKCGGMGAILLAVAAKPARHGGSSRSCGNWSGNSGRLPARLVDRGFRRSTRRE